MNPRNTLQFENMSLFSSVELSKLAAMFSQMAVDMDRECKTLKKSNAKLSAELNAVKDKELRRKFKKSLMQNAGVIASASAKATAEHMNDAIERMEEGDSDAVVAVFSEQVSIERMEECDSDAVVTVFSEQVSIERMEEGKPQTYTGVTCMPSKRWRARALNKYIGTYDTAKGAAYAVDARYKFLGKIPTGGFNCDIPMMD